MTDISLKVTEVDLNTLGAVCWELLDASAQSSSDPMRFPVLATMSGSGVDARVLVLRRADEATRTLEFHTDRRSAKIAQLQANPDMIWVFYDPVNKLQIRARGTGAACTDETLVESRWRALKDHTRRAYTQELAPGKPVASIQNGAPCAHVQDAETGRANFAVVHCVVDEFEWLTLARTGHQRAVARFGQKGWSSSWIMP